MRPPPQGAKSLEIQTGQDKMAFLMSGSIIRYISIDGRVWKTEGLFMSALSELTEKKGQFSAIVYRSLDGALCLIPFTEANIHSYLGLPGDAPDTGIDDAFIALAKAYKNGEDVNMGAIYAEISRPETNWADNPADNTIPNKINNSVLNAKATA
ncbi:hypothetical protein PIB30_030849 [Stylosanthes scabra]|uniref:Uncharacterized protein n=1 Tax=Stylosanthes scabra TaxID=79078 RepID=A0ABU6UAF8_9FABA|nr:hypothetical protein [Stylosanthes scabra]